MNDTSMKRYTCMNEVMLVEHPTGPLIKHSDLTALLIEARSEAAGFSLREMAIYLYNSGYNAGHHHTVDGGYTQVLPVDTRSYQDDVVDDLLMEFCDEAR